jgi:hypothetical protein
LPALLDPLVDEVPIRRQRKDRATDSAVDHVLAGLDDELLVPTSPGEPALVAG